MTQLRKYSTVCKAGETFNFSFMGYDRTRGKSDGIITVYRTRLSPHGHEQKTGNVKFRMFGQEFPKMGNRIDSIYQTDPDKVLFILEKLEEEQRLIHRQGKKKDGNRIGQAAAGSFVYRRQQVGIFTFQRSGQFGKHGKRIFRPILGAFHMADVTNGHIQCQRQLGLGYALFGSQFLYFLDEIGIDIGCMRLVVHDMQGKNNKKPKHRHMRR